MKMDGRRHIYLHALLAPILAFLLLSLCLAKKYFKQMTNVSKQPIYLC